MKKIIHTSDWHLGGSYPEKAMASAQFLVEQVNNIESIAYDPDLIVISGDLTDRALHIHSDHLAPFLRLIDGTDCPIVLLQGTPSHEPIGTINNLAALSPRVKVIAWPGVVHSFYDDRGVVIAVAGLPALTRPLLDKWAKEIDPNCNGFDDPDHAVRLLIDRFAQTWPEKRGPRLLMGHWSVTGCVMQTGQTVIGQEIEVPREVLSSTGADAVLLGHIHAAQEWQSPVFTAYAGPPYPTNWGELQQTSCGVILFNDEGGLVSQERLPFPHKPMARVLLDFTGGMEGGVWGFTMTSPDLPEGQSILDHSGEYEVKATYTISKEIAAQVNDMYVRVLLHKMGIEPAAIERTIIASDRQRIADIGGKQSTRAQYEAACTARGDNPRPGALDKADAIDEEATA